MKNVTYYLISSAMGIAIGVIGVFFMGYIAAIAIPKSFFNWMDENFSLLIGMVTLEVVSQSLAFGILGIISGTIIGKYRKSDWKANAFICYLSYMMYVTLGFAIIYGANISSPVSISYLKQTLGIPLLVLPLCILFSSYYAHTRTTKSSN